MSPRFSGPQHPGAMKEYRSRKRAEAEARSPRYNKGGRLPPAPMSVSHALEAIGAAFVAPLAAMVDAFRAFGQELMGKPEPTQDDFALIPHGDHVFVRDLDAGGWLPSSPRPGEVVENKTGRPEFVLTREEWAEVARRAELPEDDQ